MTRRQSGSLRDVLRWLFTILWNLHSRGERIKADQEIASPKLAMRTAFTSLGGDGINMSLGWRSYSRKERRINSEKQLL